MVKKKAAKKTTSNKKLKKVNGTAARKKTKTTAGKRVDKANPGVRKGAAQTKQVKAEKTMPSETKPEKKKKKAKVKFKSVMLREEAISYFEAIVAGLKRGSIQIRQGDDALVLRPTPQLDVAVKAASRDQEESIEFEIRWRTASDSELTISTE